MPKKKGSFKTRLEYYLFTTILRLVSLTPAFLKKLQARTLVFFFAAR